MSRRPLTRSIAHVAAAACLSIAAVSCSSSGGSDDAATTSTAPSTTEVATTEATPTTETATTEADTTTTDAGTATTDGTTTGPLEGMAPTVDEAITIYLDTASDAQTASCKSGGVDQRKLSAPSGEQQIRVTCGGIARFLYVNGTATYAKEFAASTKDLTYKKAWHLGEQAYIVPSGEDTTFAPAIQAACGCGEVIGGEG
jgi:hypothetical protein